MRTVLGLLLVAGGCGRIGFDPGVIDDLGTDDGGDGPPGAIVDAGPPADAVSGDLLAWFKFEPGANFLRDEVTGALATCTTCPTEVAGQFGGAARFDGTACVRLLDRPALRVNDLTLATWLRPLTLGQDNLISRPRNGEVSQANTWELHQILPDRLFYGFQGSGGNATGQSTAIAAATWTHVAVTRADPQNVVYLNGAQVAFNSGGIGTLAYTDDDVWIGCDRDNGALVDFFAGDLDEVKIYGRGLSAGEITDLAAAPGL